MKKNFLITVDGQLFNVTVVDKDDSGSATGAVSKPAPAPVKNVSADKVEASGQGAGIKAPMDGKILAVLVKEGEMVEQGQPLLVLEAMKLENDIVAPKSGKVASVLIKEGQKVNIGDDLVLIS